MGKRKRKVVSQDGADEELAVQPDPQPALKEHADDGKTQLERERDAIIARNRERLLALGIPSLVSELGGAASAAAAKKKQPKQKKRKVVQEDQEEAPAQAAQESKGPTGERSTRRSARLREAEEQPKSKPESAEERFERELGQFAVDQECPRCGRHMERGQRVHLEACSGPKQERGSVTRRDEALAALTEEERQDSHKVLLARMAQLHLDGLVELTAEAAKFVVLGSKGNHYTISLNDTKHTCQCLDYRFRRHNCKHIKLVLCQLDVEDRPDEWRAAVEAKMDELLEQRREREAVEARTAPVPQSAAQQVALKLL